MQRLLIKKCINLFYTIDKLGLNVKTMFIQKLHSNRFDKFDIFLQVFYLIPCELLCPQIQVLVQKICLVKREHNLSQFLLFST